MTVRYFTFFAFSNWCNGASCGVINNNNAFFPKPSDVLSAAITRTASNVIVTITDTTQGKTFTQMCSTPPAGTTLSKSCSILYKGSNAASLVWGFYRNANFPVPNFGNVFYEKDNTGLAGCGATIGGATITIKSASATVHEYQMV